MTASPHSSWDFLLMLSKPDVVVDVLRATANAVQASRVNQLLLARHLISDTKQSDQTRFQNPFQSETLPAGAEREGRLLDLSYSANER